MGKAMLKAKNWSSYQSYKDRNPPWIRLHKRLIDDINFQRMSADARATLPMLWLLISEDEEPVTGLLRIGYEEISFRLRQPEKLIKSVICEIIKAGFFEEIKEAKTDSYETVTEPLQNCHSETETYSKETETESILVAKAKIIKPEEISDDLWNDFRQLRKIKKAPVTQTALNGIKNQARLAGVSFSEALEICCQNGWAGFKAEWIINQQKGTKNGKSKLKAEADELLEQIRAGKFVEGFDGID